MRQVCPKRCQVKAMIAQGAERANKAAKTRIVTCEIAALMQVPSPTVCLAWWVSLAGLLVTNANLLAPQTHGKRIEAGTSQGRMDGDVVPLLSKALQLAAIHSIRDAERIPLCHVSVS